MKLFESLSIFICVVLISVLVVMLIANFAHAQEPVTDAPTEANTGATADNTATIAEDTGIIADNTGTIANNTGTIATSVTQGGDAGGFDPSLELNGDLEQQVAATGGLPLILGPISGDYPIAWPGYAIGAYNQDNSLGSPEGNEALTLGTLQGAMNAAADQQSSQDAELNLLENLEAENIGATSVFQLLEIANEAALEEAELDMKERNATNAQLNSINVTLSNEQNKTATDELISLADATELAQWDLTNAPMQEPIMPADALGGAQGFQGALQ